MKALSAIDCFAGAGGLALGLRQAHFRVCAAFDADPFAVATYRRNLGDHIIEAEAKVVSGARLLEIASLQRGEVTLVVGGPPCQGFSNQRRGENSDPRNQLVLEFLRIITEINPKSFLMENVSSIGTRGRATFDEFTTGGRKAGYNIYWKVLNAADFGVPQHRKRMFIVGIRNDTTATYQFPEPSHRPQEYVTVREAIKDLPPPGSSKYSNHEKDNISELNRLRISHVPQGGGREHIPPDLQLPCHAAASVEKAGHRNVYGRLHWDRPAGTITTKCNSFTRGKFAHPANDRNITMREAARLQGFPDDFHFEGGKVEVAHQIGNAVPPGLAESLGLSIIAALEGRAKSTPDAVHGQLALSL